MFLVSILVSLLLGTVSYADDVIYPAIPLLPKDPGIRYDDGGLESQVVIEVFYDLICPDSSYSWPILKDVLDHYGPQLGIVVQQIPLAYHRHSHMALQGYFLIYDQIPDRIFNYMEGMFDNFLNFSTILTVNKTETEVLGDLADLAVESTGVDRSFFIDNIADYRPYTMQVWKYAANRGVAGTPWYFVNGIDLDVYPGRPHIEYDDWIKLLDPLFEEVAKGKHSKMKPSSLKSRTITSRSQNELR